jgi:hypothetical protein
VTVNENDSYSDTPVLKLVAKLRTGIRKSGGNSSGSVVGVMQNQIFFKISPFLQSLTGLHSHSSGKIFPAIIFFFELSPFQPYWSTDRLLVISRVEHC